jgi:type I restriction enzyme S subunit
MSFNEDWKEVRLEDIVDILGDGLHGTPDYDESGEYYFINGRNLDERVFIDNKTKKVRKDEYLKYKKDLNDRTVFVSINGTLGKVAFYNGEKIILSKSVCYFNLKENINKNFIKYVLKSDFFKNYLYSYSTGTTIKNMGLKQMRNFRFNLPELFEQKRIANILYTLDKKIENNNKMNKTLEEMAQAIYKSWFVDFEPFQDGKFVESELGMIPNNIELKPLKDFFSVKTGKKNANIATDDGDYAFFTCSQGMRRTNVYSFDDTAILLAGNGDFNVKWYRGKFEAYQRTYVLIPNVTELFSFLYYSIDYFLDKLILGQRGSVISYLTKGMVEELKIPIMKDENMFNDIIKRLNNINYLIEKNENENRTLKKLRDSLLPKLMSGEIRVPLDDNAKEVN